MSCPLKLGSSYHLEVKKNRFGVVPKTVRQLYRVGDRLLTDAEWAAYTRRAKSQKEPE